MNYQEAEKKFMRAMEYHPMNREDGSCWIWPRRLTGGYGQLRVGNKVILAHRVSFQLFKQPVPAGHMLLNTCGNKACVNPDHWCLSSGGGSQVRRNRPDKRKGGGWKPGKRLEYGIKRIYEKQRELDKALKTAEEAEEEVNERIKKQGGLK